MPGSIKASEFVFDGYIEDKWDEYCDEESYEYESSFETKITDQEDTKFEDDRSYGDHEKKENGREAAIHEEQTKEIFRKTKLKKPVDGESIKTVLSWENAEEAKTEESSSSDGSNFCLQIIDASDSQLRLSSFTTGEPRAGVSSIYPILPNYKDDGIEKFFDLVREMKLRPINTMREILQSDTLDLRYYGIDPRIVEPITKAIEKNTSVQTIDLTDNWLTTDACYHLNELLITSNVITSLILSGCQIGPEGAEKLQDGIAASPSLANLNLSRCGIGNDGLKFVAIAIYCSNVLENVDLSDNKLRDETGAQYLSTMLTQTDSLKRLDLSWNSFSDEKFGDIFFSALTRNSTLEYLSIAHNGLGEDITKFLSACLINLPNLRELDLSGNRFTANDAIEIAKALSSNGGLEILRMGNNPLEASGALALVDALIPAKSPNSRLNLLDLENIWASKDILSPLEIIERDRPSLRIALGGIFGNYKLFGPDKRKIFLRRANFEAASPKKKKQRRNFGHFVLGLNDDVVSSAMFKDSVNDFKLMLSESLVDEIIKAFEIAKGQIDLAALKEYYLKEYPETQPPPPQSGKKSKKSMKNKMVKKK